MHSLFFFIVLFLNTFHPAELLAQQSHLQLVPDTSFIPSFTASGTEHRLSYGKCLSNGSFFAGLGGNFHAALIRYHGVECLVTVSGTVYTTLNNAGIRYQVTNADYYADVMFDVPVYAHTVLRIGSGHTSHHLVDDGVAAYGPSAAINYARDYYQLFIVRHISEIRGFIYGGTYYTHSFLINTRRDGQWLLQFGGDGGNFPVVSSVEIYGAFDCKFRSEVQYGSTQSYQIGLRADNAIFHAARLAYTYRTGIEERGQFYQQRSSTHSMGLYFDF